MDDLRNHWKGLIVLAIVTLGMSACVEAVEGTPPDLSRFAVSMGNK
jgi:hypothetical protein